MLPHVQRDFFFPAASAIITVGLSQPLTPILHCEYCAKEKQLFGVAEK